MRSAFFEATAAAVAVVVAEMLTLASAAASTNRLVTFLLSGSNLEWPSTTDRAEDARNCRYNPKKILINGVQMHDDRGFLTMPKMKKNGVPWSLGVFRLDPMDFEPVIRPYPDYRNHGMYCRGGGGQKNGTAGVCIINVVDTYELDGVLWTLDAGVVNTQKKPTRLGPPQLVGIDLATDTVMTVKDLSVVASPNTARLQYVVAQRTRCKQQFVFASDASQHAIVVYDVDADKLKVVQLPENLPAIHRRHAILHLMSVNRDGQGYLYMTYQHSSFVYALSSWSSEIVYHGTVTEVAVKPFDMHILGSDRGTVVYFQLLGCSDVWAWDVNRPLRADLLRHVHSGYMAYLTPTAVTAGWRDAVWALESNYDDYVGDKVDCTGPRTLLRPLNRSMPGYSDCDGDTAATTTTVTTSTIDATVDPVR